MQGLLKQEDVHQEWKDSTVDPDSSFLQHASCDLRSFPLAHFDTRFTIKTDVAIDAWAWESPAGLANLSAICKRQSLLRHEAATTCDLHLSSESLLWNGPLAWESYLSGSSRTAQECPGTSRRKTAPGLGHSSSGQGRETVCTVCSHNTAQTSNL